MKPKMEKAFSILLTSTLLLSLLMVATPKVFAQTTVVRFFPQPSPQAEITSNGQEFTVACVIEDVSDLAGLDIQIAWNTTYLQYVSHTQTMSVEDYPTVQPPSPYAGIIHDPTLTLADEVENVPGTYWAAFATLGGPSFDGSGTVFTMTFKAINLPYGDPTAFFYKYLNFTSVDLAAGAGGSISHIREDGVIKHWYRQPCVCSWPLLKIDPASYEGTSVGEVFTYSVWLLGEGGTHLDPFWDVGGIDVYMNFDPTLIEAIDASVDPDGTFKAFWPNGIFEIAKDIDNGIGIVHVSFLGYGEPHIAPYGQIRMFSVDFKVTYESTEFPPPTAPVTLKNPTMYTGAHTFDSIGGPIIIADPVDTTYYELAPDYLAGPFELTSWEDNGDGVLSPSDQLILNHTGTGWYYDYHLEEITGTLNLTQQPHQTVEDYVWVASFGPDNLANNGLPGRYVGTDDPYNGFGVPYWTGNFSMPGLSSVNSITVHALPFTADEYTYTLTAGVDYIAYPDEDLIELLTPVDVPIINEHWKDGINNTLGGWPWILYLASGIENVTVHFPNCTTRPARNYGYAQPPPSEWWYDPDWAWELEGWSCLGYYPALWSWPTGSEWWINYTAASYLSVDYNTEPDPNPRYLAFRGSYENFLAWLTRPIGGEFDEEYPCPWRDYAVVGWTDSDGNRLVNPSDYLQFFEHEIGENRTYLVNSLGVDIFTRRKPWICEDDPTDPFFGVAPIVQIAGFPHPERDYCPWHNKDYSVPLPHVVEDATYTAPYKALGGFIDVYTQYPAPFGGQGKDKPSDMFWPQKNVMLCANVTYAGWPEQNKDVAFEVKYPNGEVFTILYNRTNEYGVACVKLRLPWPCDNPELIFGKWKVWATVDVSCIIVNDTVEFKYDYEVNIWNVETDKEEYMHCENIEITIHYGSYMIQKELSGEPNNITFTVTVVDASGVPFGFDYIVVALGTDNMNDWCMYLNGTVVLTVHVVKWARPPMGTIYVGALNGFPQDGGSAETPVYSLNFAILAYG